MAKRKRTGPTLVQRSRRVSPEDKAIFHHETGAGRSRVKRQFFDLSADDEREIVARLQAHLDKVAGGTA